MLRVTNLIGFGGIAAPSILSANSTSVAEGDSLAFTIITDRPATISIGGTDAAEFEIGLSTGTTHILRWTGDGDKDYDSPDDADSNNVYAITLTPVSLAGNDGVAQNFSVTVTDGTDWVTAFNIGGSMPNENMVGGYTYRQVIPASLITAGGSTVRFVLAGPSDIMGLSYLYIGEQGAGDPYDMKSTSPAPAQILVSGSGGINFNTANVDVVTDALSFAIDETKTYVVSWYSGATVGFGPVRNATGITGAQAYRKFGDEAATANVSGYSSTGADTMNLIRKMQVV